MANTAHAPQYFRPARHVARERQPWHGVAFFVEAIILMMFLVGTMAVFSSILMSSHARAVDTRQLTNAIVATANEAEAFAAQPQAGTSTIEHESFVITRNAEAMADKGGTLYCAELITTDLSGQEIYRLSTSKYVSEVN